MRTNKIRSVAASLAVGLLCVSVNGANAAGTLYARAIGEPPEPEPRTTPQAPAEPGTPPTESPAPQGEGVKGSTILLGVGIAAALAALGGGGGGGGGGGSSTSH